MAARVPGHGTMSYNDYDGPHADLRELIERIDRSGQLLRVGGVHPSRTRDADRAHRAPRR